jgi:hypothetical protein
MTLIASYCDSAHDAIESHDRSLRPDEGFRRLWRCAPDSISKLKPNWKGTNEWCYKVKSNARVSA